MSRRSDWLGLAEATLLLAGARGLIRFVPYRWWRRAMRPIGARALATERRDRANAMRVALLIRRAAPHMPFLANCLPQALTARWMLARRGTAAELHLGARDTASEIELHAWVTVSDIRVTGGEGEAVFAAFAATSRDGREQSEKLLAAPR